MAVILFRIIMLLSLYQKWTAPAIKDPAASNEVFDSRGSRQISMQAWIPGSLLAEINHGPIGNLSTTVSVLT
ncbi:hypothetical protein DWY69_00500 [Eisenbergiella massiliensis]|uniref:Uncharacterized protein n=1 Tax=Eisenbergiella massiliensis TaxID=1720294 RepID=A0A3E3J588_9FIRM|nr:hypothetical protein DXC51_07850 [Eisenbergiella massiliensis]RGE74486.1 hypothetical protein DWY69_00500 [Eisenbergiella massiliensis]